ncbi:unnamed protein product [Notodromas monacha]|nr:unnamed protein product [Notodromas monacha]CAG0924799.1 unnamed protein product [Notodromas monacha]
MSLKLRPCLTFLKHRALWFRTPRRSCSNLEDDEKRGGFAKAFEKYTDPEFLEPKKPAQATPKQDLKFATLLRNSRLMQIGDPEGAVVTGEIYHVVGDDLYVEFGWKFPCVVRRPERNAE